MIQRSEPLRSISCACQRAPALVTSRGCPGTRYHVECARCEIRTARHPTSAEAIRAWTRSPTAAPTCATPNQPGHSKPGAAVFQFPTKATA